MARDFTNWTHGTRSTYVGGCRCDDCTEANTIGCEAMKRRRQLPPDDPRHGTPTGYGNWGCRCLACCQAYVPINARTVQRQREARQEARRG